MSVNQGRWQVHQWASPQRRQQGEGGPSLAPRQACGLGCHLLYAPPGALLRREHPHAYSAEQLAALELEVVEGKQRVDAAELALRGVGSAPQRDAERQVPPPWGSGGGEGGVEEGG